MVLKHKRFGKLQSTELQNNTEYAFRKLKTGKYQNSESSSNTRPNLFRSPISMRVHSKDLEQIEMNKSVIS